MWDQHRTFATIFLQRQFSNEASLEFSEIQVGIDLATSATIIFSAVAFWSQYVKNAREAQRSDKIERTRATALARLYEISHEFEDAYRDLLEVHRAINEKRWGNPYGQLLRVVPETDEHKSKEDINRLVMGYQRFAELIFKRRYTLLPLLEVIDEETVDDREGGSGNQSKSTVWEDVQQLKNSEIWICTEHDYFNHLFELRRLVDAALAESATDSADEEIAALYDTDEGVRALTRKILTDASFLKFNRDLYTRLELETKDSEELARYINSPGSVAHWPETMARVDATISRAAAEFLGQAGRKSLYRIVERAESDLKRRLDDSTLLCKTVLIKISALLCKTLRNRDDVGFTDIVDRYEGKYYLNKADIHQ